MAESPSTAKKSLSMNDAEKIIEKCTGGSKNEGVDWDAFMHVVDLVNQNPAKSKDFVKLLQKRSSIDEAKAALLSLELVDCIAKNCESVRAHIGSKDFQKHLINLATSNKTSTKVQSQIVDMVSEWVDEFVDNTEMAGYKDVLETLVQKIKILPASDTLSNSEIEQLVKDATSDARSDPDWQAFMQVCDVANRNPKCLRLLTKLLSRRITENNTKVVLLSLELVGTLVKNCPSMHSHFGSVSFQKILSALAHNLNTKSAVRDKVVNLLQEWQQEHAATMPLAVRTLGALKKTERTDLSAFGTGI